MCMSVAQEKTMSHCVPVGRAGRSVLHNVRLSNAKWKLLFPYAPGVLALYKRDFNLRFNRSGIEGIKPQCSLLWCGER